jgi:hypothetical protein
MNADYQVLEAKGLFCFSVILWLSVVDVGTMQPATTKGTNQIALSAFICDDQRRTCSAFLRDGFSRPIDYHLMEEKV